MKSICVTAQLLSAPLWRAGVDGQYVITPETGCWEWTGHMDRHGYGVVRAHFGGRKRGTGAHRASWIVHRGPIAGDLTIDHLCRNTRCINPSHLEPVSMAENIRRATKAGAFGKPARRIYVETPKLAARRGCKAHGKAEGYWCERKDHIAWACTICVREKARSRREETKRKLGKTA